MYGDFDLVRCRCELTKRRWPNPSARCSTQFRYRVRATPFGAWQSVGYKGCSRRDTLSIGDEHVSFQDGGFIAEEGEQGEEQTADLRVKLNLYSSIVRTLKKHLPEVFHRVWTCQKSILQKWG